LRLLLVLSWITTGYGTLIASLDHEASSPMSATAIGLLALVTAGFTILRRAPAATTDQQPVDEGIPDELAAAPVTGKEGYVDGEAGLPSFPRSQVDA
jgi:hypothetical protein